MVWLAPAALRGAGLAALTGLADGGTAGEELSNAWGEPPGRRAGKLAFFFPYSREIREYFIPEAADYHRQAAHLATQGHETSCATDLNMGGIGACSWKCGAKSAFIVPNNLFLTITFD